MWARVSSPVVRRMAVAAAGVMRPIIERTCGLVKPLAAGTLQEPLEGNQQSRRGPPKEALAVVHRPVLAQPPAVEGALVAMVGGVEEEGERHLEDVGDLVRIGPVVERRLDPADDGRDRVAGGSPVLGNAAEDRHLLGRDSDLLAPFAKRGAFPRAVLLLAATACETDLPGMVGEAGGTLGEHHPWLRRVIHHEQQHGRGLAPALPRLGLLL